MLYLIRPLVVVEWNELPSTSVLQLARDTPDWDLAGLVWQRADQPFTADLLCAAVRYGHPCSAGVVLPGIIVLDLNRPDELRRAHHHPEPTTPAAAGQQLVTGRLLPGRGAPGPEPDTRAAVRHRRLEQAEKRVADLLVRAPDPRLVDHWLHVGGPLTSSEQAHPQQQG